ncbi:MAG: DUF790 family protein [Chloroflexi bacterium]|nr:DUF790 family protein [Chloroflexota bacterium]
MSIPLENLPRRYLRREGAQWVAPYLAQGADERPFLAALNAAVAVAERALGQSRREAGPELLEPLFPQALGGYRSARAAWACLLETYGFEQAPVAAAMGAGPAAALAARGVASPWDLRRALFLRLGAGAGFAAPDERAGVLTDLARAQGGVATGEQIEQALWLDAPAEAILTRYIDPPEPRVLLARFRQRVLEGLLFHSVEVRLLLPDGGAWRTAYSLAKALRLAVEPEPGGKLTLRGWAAAVADRGVGGRLADAALALVMRHGARGQATVHLNGRDYLLALDDGVGAALPRKAEAAPSYDSAVEETLARDLVQLGPSRRGWEVVREPAPLVVGETVIMPDFMCRRGSLEVYLEVVGFWTEDYRERKLAKLRTVAEALPGLKLALAVDATLPGFDGLPFPALSYRNDVDAAALLRFLETHFDDLESRLERNRAQLQQTVDHLVGERWHLSPDATAAAAGCFSQGELGKVLDGWEPPAAARWTPGVGLCGEGFLGEVRTALDASVGPNGASLDEVAAALAASVGYRGDLAALVAAVGGYAVRWESLLEGRVVRAG